MESAQSVEQPPESRLTLSHDGDYFEIVDAQFMALALREQLTRFRGLNWPTGFTDIDSLGDVLYAASYNARQCRCVLVRLPTAIALLAIQHQRFAARLSAATEQGLDEAERLLRGAVPRSAPDPERQEVPVAFWHANRQSGGGVVSYARLPVPRWEEVQGNYTAQTRERLEKMVDGFQAGHGGRLILWTGPPGTGKTYALRMLAWEWRKWCSVHYVADPDAAFGAHGDYLMELVTRKLPGQKWRLLVLEDTGELLAADAKARTGQGLSRLLNLVDGLLGQGFPTLVLITANDKLSTFHPAIARPGRCGMHIDFKPLSEEESGMWLDQREVEASVTGEQTLAELYALAEGYETAEPAGRRVGFIR